MLNLDKVVATLEQLAPLHLAEEWDNVGLLVGDRAREVERVMTCLTLTPTTAVEAVRSEVDLVVVHHPLPFRPISRVTTDSTVGRMLWDLIGAQVAVYSAHTAFDSALGGINELWAKGLGLSNVDPLMSIERSAPQDDANLGSGRCGMLSESNTLAAVAERVRQFLSLDQVRVVGEDVAEVLRVAIACGSGGSFLAAAGERQCQCLVTGEANFHTCLEAEATGVAMILTGHYASERFAMERLAEQLSQLLPGVEVWASRDECDPLRFV